MRGRSCQPSAADGPPHQPTALHAAIRRRLGMALGQDVKLASCSMSLRFLQILCSVCPARLRPGEVTAPGRCPHSRPGKRPNSGLTQTIRKRSVVPRMTGLDNFISPLPHLPANITTLRDLNSVSFTLCLRTSLGIRASSPGNRKCQLSLAVEQQGELILFYGPQFLKLDWNNYDS